MVTDTDEITVLDKGVAHGRKYKVCQIRGKHFAGYVQTNFSSDWGYGEIRGHMSSLVECHGGLTYGVDAEGFVGFDCAHAGDVCIRDGTEQTDHAMSNRREWTPEDVAEECERVAQQIETLEEFAETFADRGW